MQAQGSSRFCAKLRTVAGMHEMVLLSSGRHPAIHTARRGQIGILVVLEAVRQNKLVNLWWSPVKPTECGRVAFSAAITPEAEFRFISDKPLNLFR